MILNKEKCSTIIYHYQKLVIQPKKIIKNLKNNRSIDEIIEFVKENKGIEYSEKIMIDMTEKTHSILNRFLIQSIKKAYMIF